jgi:hypothetical protein
MLIAGCDPGFNGAMSMIDVDGDNIKVRCVDDLPTKLTTIGGGKKRRMYDLPMLLKLMKKYSACTRMYLESNLIIDTNSKFSIASTAFGAGLILGVGHAIGVDVQFCSPKTWQAWVNKEATVCTERERMKVNGKKPDSKQLAELFVKSQYKECIKLIYGPRGGLLDGRADAICIATFGAREVMRERMEALCKSK